MNEWASKIMNMSFPNNSNRAEFDKYMSEVRNQNLEYMSYNKDFDEEVETRPSFEQVSQDLILEEANKNIMILKSLENIMQERMQGYNQFLTTLSKSKTSFEAFQYCNGTLRQSLDSFFIFIEQELQQARQHITLNDIRKSLSEVKVDAQKRLNDYQKEILNADREIANAEKKLAKTKESLEKHVNWKEHVESESNSSSARNLPRTGILNRETSRSIERIRDTDELLLRYEREIKDDIRAISRAMAARDDVLVASRKAFQTLDRDCKKAVGQSLKKLVVRERETNAARNAVLDKLEATIDSFDADADIMDFILSSRDPDNALVLHSQALNILGDLNPNLDSNRNSPQPSGDDSASASPLRNTNDDGSLHRTWSGSSKDSSVSTPNAQAISNLIFSVHNMFGNASSMLFPPGSANNSPAKVSHRSLPQRDIKRTPSFNRNSAYLQKSPDQSASPTQSIPATTPIPNNPETLAAEAAMEGYLHCIFYAKHSFEISTAAAVSAALSKKPASNSSPATPSSIVTAADALSHSMNSSPLPKPLPPAKPTKSTSAASAPATNTSTLKQPPPADIKLEQVVAWLVRETDDPIMRTLFITELNKFRSKKVDVGIGFMALGAVLWAVLMQSQASNDVHSAKVIMMLIQTFYRKRTTPLKSDSLKRVDTPASVSSIDTTSDVSMDDDETNVDRGVAQREYLKEILISHPIWQDGNFWEQILWQCAIEQLQTIPYPTAWHDLDKDKRQETVIRVHNVIFSQVMAIAHSMMELGCGKPMIREFVYRMCVIHQLSEAQRQQMLEHLLTR